MKVIIKCVDIKLWDLLGCFHYILNGPRKRKNRKEKGLNTSLKDLSIALNNHGWLWLIFIFKFLAYLNFT